MFNANSGGSDCQDTILLFFCFVYIAAFDFQLNSFEDFTLYYIIKSSAAGRLGYPHLFTETTTIVLASYVYHQPCRLPTYLSYAGAPMHVKLSDTVE